MDPTTNVSLTRLLTHLATTLDHPPPALRSSPYERSKLRTNLAHAQTLLQTLEKQSSTIRAQPQRQRNQDGLTRHRTSIKHLSTNLQGLEQAAQQTSDDSSADDSDDESEDLLLAYAPARKDVAEGLEASGSGGGPSAPPSPPPQLQPANDPSLRAPSPPTLRARKPLSASDNRYAAATTARDALFAALPKDPTHTTQPAGATTATTDDEPLLTHNRTEQDTLTTSLLALASSLKTSSQQFSSSLAAEKDVLKRAEGGLDKSSAGMGDAERRMGMLRRMSEGQGWWGRVKLYGFIGALWLACILIVFVAPKLRF